MTNKSAMDLSEIRDQIEKIKVTAKEDKEISGLISHEIELMEDMLKKLQDQNDRDFGVWRGLNRQIFVDERFGG